MVKDLIKKIGELGWSVDESFVESNGCTAFERKTLSGRDYVFFVYGKTLSEIKNQVQQRAIFFDPEEYATNMIRSLASRTTRTLLADGDDLAAQLRLLAQSTYKSDFGWDEESKEEKK